jgi:predicted RNA-binding Zn-ribbon protein involved in translation (DUF1610 family)
MHNQFDEPFGLDAPHAEGTMHEPFENTFPTPPSSASAVTPPCPECQSLRIETRNHARKIGGAIGTVAGTTSGVAYALSGAEIGAMIGVLAGPIGSICGALAGAVIAGLIGGAAGCAAGAVLGEVVDANVLNNYRCHACGYTFSGKQP